MKVKDNKQFELITHFDIVTKSEDSDDDTGLVITGYASTGDKDRDNDVILPKAWVGGLANFKKNPIILAQHDHTQPIGKATEFEIDDKGLRLSARISKAAGNTYQLIKEGILSTFSVGFIVKDADYDRDTGIFVIKKAELFEVSVVSVPANAGAVFNVSKNFNSQDEFEDYKNQFIDEGDQLMKTEKDTQNTPEPVDILALAKSIKDELKKDLEKEAAEKAAAEKAKAEEDARIAAIATTGAEKLVADLKKELEEKDGEVAEVLKSLRDEIKEKAAEIEELNKAKASKMSFSADGDESGLTKDEKDAAVLIKLIKGAEGFQNSAFRKNLIEKGTAESLMDHFVSGALTEWQEEFNTTVYNAMREELVVERAFNTLSMPTPTLHLPINPDVTVAAEWISNNNFRGAGSTGTAAEHQITDKTLIAYKLVGKEYIGYEEEEDSIVAIMPIIRESLARRMAIATDRALLRGTGVTTAGSTFDPLAGLDKLAGDVGATRIVEAAGGITYFDEDDVVSGREKLGIYGIDTTGLVLMLSYAGYYQIMKSTNFKTVDVLGPAATLITGQVGSIYGVPVVVSRAFDNAAITAGTAGTCFGILVRPSNFVVGNHRTMLTENDRDIEQQKSIIVVSRRMAFEDYVEGEGVVTYRLAS